ncbi:MAG: tRNA (5-methylaminomethyl-2-thiouridine)(34)-methyltransferase MnmD, partial [Candidatus Puniceispirillales bacterium]
MIQNPMIETLLDPDCSLDESGGQPRLRSNRFDDIYFSGEDGLAETVCVFLEGNGLPERFKGRDHFVIAETGFGTGLNFLAVMAEIERMGDAAPHLTYLSTEIAPLDTAMIDQVLSPWPQLDHLRAMLVAALPPRWPGRHRRHFLGGKVTLDLLYGDSITVLERCQFKADAWFLDGFTPARNPLMWNDKLFSLIGGRSAAGATVSSFTAAGDVRRGLEKAGFSISRHPGFGGKRHRITGVFNGTADEAPAAGDPGRVAIIGAGIAGASVAASLRMRGLNPVVIGAGTGSADGASGNIAAIQAPRLTASDTPEARLSLTAWGYARYWASQSGAGLDERTILLAHDDRETLRQLKIARLGWPETVYRQVDAAEAARLTGVETGLGGMVFDHGGVVDPAAFVRARLDGVETRLGTTITGIERR